MSQDKAPYKTNRRDWGRILLATRLEKMVDADFVAIWSHLISKGLRPTDGFLIVKDRVAHMAANDAFRVLLSSDFDTIMLIDSDFDAGPGYVEEIRTLEDGFDFDIFQGFYTRRGWPPEAIWFKETELGDTVQSLVWKDNHTEETSMVGFHNALIRREVIEKMLESRPEVETSDFTWAYYPRDNWQSEDGVFCQDARALGFRVGSTTKVKCGHITRLTTGWETYQEYLKLSGAFDKWRRYYDLVELVADFTGETYDEVIAKSMRGSSFTRDHWKESDPKTGDEIRAFYGDKDNGYLYDLLAWNVSPGYHSIVDPLEDVEDLDVLVVGGGLGSEVERLKKKNRVSVFELVGILGDFIWSRYEHDLAVEIDLGDKLSLDLFERANIKGSYRFDFDLIVAVDVIEHIPPDELEDTLDIMLELLRPGGRFFFHNNFGARRLAPQHFDHAERFTKWLDDNDIEQVSELEYQRIDRK